MSTTPAGPPRVDLGGTLLSASNLVAWVQCRHLAWRALEVKAGRLVRPPASESARLVARKGDEHEQAHVDGLRSAGREVVEIDTGLAPERAAAQTAEVMGSGAEVIYQAVLHGPPWIGHADFLERVDVSSDLGEHSYQVADTKLARSSTPSALIQLWLYSSLLAEIQGHDGGDVHVILGDGRRESFEIRRYSAYCRRVACDMLATIGDDGLAGAYPEPIDHCQVCEWDAVCAERRDRDDHLSRIPRIPRPQRARLERGGITTVAALAAAGDDARPARMQAASFDAHRHHARLQVASREDGVRPRYELVPYREGRGFDLLPAPDPGDLFFDIEGDPWIGDDGLEYLFGVVEGVGEGTRFTAFWATEPAEERVAFERLVDVICARRAQHPRMHVYHYAAYEKTALRNLMSRHGTREDEVDDLLRNEVLVDLLPVVTQTMRTSLQSYSIKAMEAFYFAGRSADVADGGASIVEFERWLETGEQAILDDIARYNEEDCVSTLELRDWLLGLRAESPGATPPEEIERESKDPPEVDPEFVARAAALEVVADGWTPGESEPDHSREHQAWLLRHLLEYHRRESKPEWWEYFEREKKDEAGLREDGHAMAGITYDPAREPRPVKRSLEYTLDFPSQEHRVRPGAMDDPFTRKSFTVTGVDDATGEVRVKMGASRDPGELPTALVPGTPLNHTAHEAALGDLADALTGDETRLAAARDVLAVAPPRFMGRSGPIVPDGAGVEQISAAIAALDESYLPIQGPPGTGKTYTSARALVDLIDAGRRVAVAGPSHKAIHNLLHEVEKVADERGVSFRGFKKASTDNEESFFASRLPAAMIESSARGRDADAEDLQLLAGTSWFIAGRPEADVDHLVIDEAGQISLADALAMARATKNLVLVGDPMQLPQVAQGVHPPGVAGSVLEHLLQRRSTVPPERGVFLARTRRLHPEICAYVSEIAYDGRLGPSAECADQHVTSDGLTGAGLRFIGVEHEHNARRSPEEAERIAWEIGRLLGGRVAMKGEPERELRPDDVMVVAPYNAQVREISSRVPEGVRVGTIDKFQGQEAAVVFISMATSSGDDAPRDLSFLLSINRLNVAVSRARCLAVMVASPELLRAPCRSPEQMELVNALCRFVERAQGVSSTPGLPANRPVTAPRAASG